MPNREEWTSPTEAFRGRGALVVATPGQELRVWSWLVAFDPLVFVLADGTGRAATVRNLIQAQASVGSVFCRATTEGIERALVDGDHPRLAALAHELGEEFVRYKIDYVVRGSGDSPTDRACRLLVDAATGIAARTMPGLRTWEVSDDSGSAGVTLPADGDLWDAKRRAIQTHSHPPSDSGLDGMRVERFVPARPFARPAKPDGVAGLRPLRAGVSDVEAALECLSEVLLRAVAGASPAKVAA